MRRGRSGRTTAIEHVIGRAAELALVANMPELLASGAAAVVLVGEAGTGKTTVWRYGVDAARSRGATVLVTRPGEAETRLPYAGLADLLAEVPEAELAALPPVQRRAIDVALLKRDPGVEPLEQRAIAAGLLTLVRHLAVRSRVVVAIDDVHWLDEPSTRVLNFVLRRVANEPIGLLAAVRASDIRPEQLGLDSWPAERRSIVEIGSLSMPEVDRLVHDRLRVALPRATLRRLHELSGGNPFFALEIGRALLRQGVPTAVGAGLPVPDTLRELVLSRLYHLPGPVRDVLLAVAALSRPTVAQVRTALGDEARVAGAIGRAEDAGVIELEGDQIRFSHPLLASVLYSETRPDARRDMHRRLAAVVPDADERARHLALATVGVDESVAAALEAAAGRTRVRGAPDAAAALGDRARELTPPDQTSDVVRRTLMTADAYLAAGASTRAAELLEPLVANLPPGPEQARALLSLGRVHMLEHGLLSAQPLLERAASVAGADARLQAAIGRDRSTALTQSGDLRHALAGARETLDWAERTGDRELVRAALVQLVMVEFLLGRGIRDDLLERASTVAGGVASDPDGGSAYVPADLVRGAVLKWSDRFEEAAACFDAVRNRAIASGDETPWGSLLFQAGELELWAGRWDTASAMAEEARAAADRRVPTMHEEHAYLRAAIEAHRGNERAARSTAGAAMAQAERTGDLRFRIRCEALLGFVDLSGGDADAAVRRLERAWIRFQEAGYGDPGVIRFVPDLVEAAVLLGRTDRAEELQAWLDERARTLDRPYALATGSRCRALLLASQGRTEAALEAAAAAIDHHRRLPQPFELARSSLVRGGLLRRAKAKREAREALTTARTIFESLGARSWAARASGELSRIGGRAPTVAGLTPTEARVARLAADGYGNQEIAERLFVSPKTVEGHLTRIYDKLDVHSRGELARRARTGGIPDVPGNPAT